MKASTLVLVDDAEFDVEVSTSQIAFPNWANGGAELARQSFTIVLVPRENAEATSTTDDGDDDTARVPLVITAPFTQRFRVDGPAELASPLMPLLSAKTPLRYSVQFVRPLVTESDDAWDNFQDQIVVQTRLGTLVVVLQALRERRVDGLSAAFSPHALPTVKAPSLKLFEYIEKCHRPGSSDRGAAAARRPLPTVSESFNSSKKKAESALAPLGSLPAVLQAEATAVILRLRARNSTRAGASSQRPPPPANDDALPSEDAFPESRLDATTKAELDAFHHLVASARDSVARGRASAKSELDFYRQFLPRAPSEPGGVATPRFDRAMPCAKSAKALFAARALARLPTLAASAASADTLADVGGNQEVSPVRVSVMAKATATDGLQAASMLLSTKKKATVGGDSRTPSAGAKRRAKAATGEGRRRQEPSSSVRPIAARTASHPQQQQQLGGAKKPVLRTPTHSKTRLRADDSAAEASLSDFDDPDPEVDDAPIFPDDLGGMRVATDDGDEDEY
ncbi:hypothetical protein PybrP1_012018 [[Pythium] brassicae (nom. inval.)]|nr:hypothetical protein PybrP1_012018 [[Pythium] brassicae (nom. inval.)]